jgi:hypothetical protein
LTSKNKNDRATKNRLSHRYVLLATLRLALSFRREAVQVEGSRERTFTRDSNQETELSLGEELFWGPSLKTETYY